eukprot:770364-Amorphochlora_amoeboformis.AAC.1
MGSKRLEQPCLHLVFRKPQPVKDLQTNANQVLVPPKKIMRHKQLGNRCETAEKPMRNCRETDAKPPAKECEMKQ